jgi:hypothetical protein
VPQVTIYLPKDLLQAVRVQAQRARMSVSAYMTEMTRKAVLPSCWPDDFEQLYGSCSLMDATDLTPDPEEAL